MDPHSKVEKINASPAAGEQEEGVGISKVPPAYKNSSDNPPPDDNDAGTVNEVEKYRSEKMTYFEKLRMMCIKLGRENKATNQEKSHVSELSVKAGTYHTLIMDGGNDLTELKAIYKRYKEWTTNRGYLHMDSYKSVIAKVKGRREQEKLDEERNKPKALEFSDKCNIIYADMNDQFSRWNGKDGKHRGAWWGPAGPGQKAGAKTVPIDVVLELKKKVKLMKEGWWFSDSWSGGISFHKNGGSVAFIYHMLPPTDGK